MWFLKIKFSKMATLLILSELYETIDCVQDYSYQRNKVKWSEHICPLSDNEDY